mgnify:FL=1
MDKGKLLQMGMLATAAALPALLNGPGRKPKPTPKKGGRPPMRPMPAGAESVRDRAERRARIEQAINEAKKARGEWDR